MQFNHHHNQDFEHFCHPQKFPYDFLQSVHMPTTAPRQQPSYHCTLVLPLQNFIKNRMMLFNIARLKFTWDLWSWKIAKAQGTPFLPQPFCVLENILLQKAPIPIQLNKTLRSPLCLRMTARHRHRHRHRPCKFSSFANHERLAALLMPTNQSEKNVF